MAIAYDTRTMSTIVLGRSISIDPTGQWLASGSDDASVRLWEIETGRQLWRWDLDDVVECVSFN
eukprot:COSAG05_NODE_10332_length_571_cov_0.764831_1_plen_63_part_01